MTIDDTVRACAARIASPLREIALELPYRLGIAGEPGGSWETFFVLPPNRHLPAWIATTTDTGEDPICVDEETLSRFIDAHHLALAHGMIRDRIRDRQIEPTSEMLAMRGVTLDWWVESLAAATEDRAFARRIIGRSLREWRAGVIAEARALSSRTLSVFEYVETTRAKLRWLSATACALVEQTRGLDRSRDFLRCYDVFLLGLQCLDDADDAEDDARLLGASVPFALGTTEKALRVAAPVMVALAADRAAEGGFRRLSRWMSSFAEVLRDRLPGEVSARDRWLGVTMAGACGRVR